MTHQRYSSNTPWEPIAGYSRAAGWQPGLRVRHHRHRRPRQRGRAGDVYGQTVQTLRNVERALNALGAELRHVVRTRMYVVDIDDWEAVARAHGEFFAAIRPATSMVEVSRLIDPAMLVEIEADAIIAD
ncbi:MAG: RidA family protein [Caldilineales bacterium]